jgi:hypothetical protein
MVNRRWASALPLVVAILAGCAGPDLIRSPDVAVPTGAPVPVPVVIYGRNATSGPVWIGVQPIADQLQSIGFNEKGMGVGCLTIRAGSEVDVLAGNPADGPTHVVRRIAVVAPPPDLGAQVIWIDIGLDSSVLTGTGVPKWWTSEPGGDCPR